MSRNAISSVSIEYVEPAYTELRLDEIGPDQWITRKGKKRVVVQIADIHPMHLVRIVQKLIAHKRASLPLDRTIVAALADVPQWPALLEAGKRHGLYIVDGIYDCCDCCDHRTQVDRTVAGGDETTDCTRSRDSAIRRRWISSMRERAVLAVRACRAHSSAIPVRSIH